MTTESLKTIAGTEIPGREDYAVSRSSMAHLAMHVAGNTLFSSVYDTDREEIIWLKEYSITENDPDGISLQRLFQSEKIFDTIYRRSSISTTPGDFALIPSGFFDENKKEILLSSTVIPSVTLQHAVKPAGAALVYAFPEGLEKQVARKFPTLKTVSFAAIFTEFALNRAGEGNHLFLQCSDHRMVIVFVRDRKLLLCNQFEIRRADDVLYHLANSAIQLGADLASLHLHYGGDIVSFPELEQMLGTYCGHPKKLSHGLRYIKSFVPEHEAPFFAAISHFTCAL